MAAEADLLKWTPLPAELKPVVLQAGEATLTEKKWSFLQGPGEHANAELSAMVTIEEPAKELGYFGQSWSAWPDPTYGDGGFEAGLLLRGRAESGYRVQLSHQYQTVALVMWPEGGYVAVAPCTVKLKAPHQLRATVQADEEPSPEKLTATTCAQSGTMSSLRRLSSRSACRKAVRPG